ncbi:MAG: pyrroline-5-carboxylate reductase [Veillonella sp.]|nr:pyrroline-5-carboxylate reductase [Veillonella sp.]
MLGKTLCIGVGSMGGALLRGALQHGVLKACDTHILVRREEQCKALAEELGVVGFTTLPNVNEYNTILLAVKPQVLPSVLETLKEVPYGTVMISAMPNTPASIGAGMTALAGDDVNTDLGRTVRALFEAVGEVAVVSEADLDRLGALSGAGPGYMFVILDALADAGVRIGLPRQLAIKAAAQTMYGAGKMALESGNHPAVLRDQVTSPGGTTIAGIGAMEKGGLRSALQDGVVACLARSNELGK